jgi:hypothetical protein
MPLTDDQKTHLESLYAGRHKGFLLTHHPQAYAVMEKAGTLTPHLQDIGRQAARMYETILDQMRAKASEIGNQSDRQIYLDSIPLTASEIVHSDIVYMKM